MKDLPDDHPMVLVLEDRSSRSGVCKVYIGDRRKSSFTISSSELDSEGGPIRLFIDKEMDVIDDSPILKGGRKKVTYRTNFDLLTILDWLRRNRKGAEIYKDEGKKGLLRYLRSAKDLLKDPIPDRRKMKEVFGESKLMEHYKKILKLGQLPRNKIARKIFLKLRGAESEYKSYRRKADETLERLYQVIRSVENTIYEVGYL